MFFSSLCYKDVGFRSEALGTILQQEVLLQEDVELIELFDPSILSAGQLKQQEHGHLPTLHSLATPNIWYSLELYTCYMNILYILLEEVYLHTWPPSE